MLDGPRYTWGMNTTLTAIEGVRVGHAQDDIAQTGCTVVLLPEGTTAAVDVRGGAPGTRETDLLSPEMMVPHINAICFAGGSAFGLAAADGVMQTLYERGIGFPTGIAPVPIVPAAVIFDLGVGSVCWPDAAMGRAATESATTAPVACGQVGVGRGASVGKLFGPQRASPGGLASRAATLPDGTTVAVLVVVNAFGDVIGADGQILAGARTTDGHWANTASTLKDSIGQVQFRGSNTTLALVATDATLSKAECLRLAQMAQDGVARSVHPVHTPYDGDIVFAAATGARPAPPLIALGTLAAELLADAIRQAVSPPETTP